MDIYISANYDAAKKKWESLSLRPYSSHKRVNETPTDSPTTSKRTRAH